MLDAEQQSISCSATRSSHWLVRGKRYALGGFRDSRRPFNVRIPSNLSAKYGFIFNSALSLSIKRSRLNWVRFGDPHSHMGAPVPAFIRTILFRWRRLGAVGPKRADKPCMSGHELKNALLAARRRVRI